MRKFMRAIAKANMKKKGICRFCKKDVQAERGMTSYFAQHWREYV